MQSSETLLFVYNADSSLFNQVGDLVHKTISPKTYQCNLCGLTYSGVKMNSEWKNFIDSLPVKAEFLHRDEFIKKYPNIKQTFPAVFIKNNKDLSELISTNEINRTKNLEELKELVRVKNFKDA